MLNVVCCRSDESRRDEISTALENHLQANATRLSRNPTFQPYFGSRSRTPFKTRSSSTVEGGVVSDDAEVRSVVRGRGRRATKVKQELEYVPSLTIHQPILTPPPLSDDDPISSPAPIVSTTITKPRATSRSRSRPRPNPTLPASPADVADLAEYETTQLYTNLADLYTLTGLPALITSLRETCSTLAAVHLLFLTLELLALQPLLLPWTFAYDLQPPPPFPENLGLYYPDLFALLTPAFWRPFTLWTTTSILLPATISYFFNLTTRTVKRGGARVSVARYTFDPLTFSVAKGLATWMVYGRGVLGAAGIVDLEMSGQVNRAFWGGYEGVLVGCYVCVLAAIWEEVQRK